MSKEQTPITAGGWLIKNGCDDLVIRGGSGKHFFYTSDAMEQYANAKVLEALERLIVRIDEINDDNDKTNNVLTSYGVIKLIETEVKPKYI